MIILTLEELAGYNFHRTPLTLSIFCSDCRARFLECYGLELCDKDTYFFPHETNPTRCKEAF
ncbi:hypothetical protein O6H91_13G025300 [Diphasiastrum complanatum]|uniref:Uncharacterized protein n=1 Tax=Diphasiastrum complanatum TaxID=34168 RepID=A0ACC2BT87_DIPCM|nr:hypothetical protein O6H91_13G025300 [Diphasiastrum complanatum]